jgi:N-methylhydantoinase A
MIRLATDVGGTFTDLVGYDTRTGRLFTAKSLTTTADQSSGVLDVIDIAEKKGGLRGSDVTFFAHGGTTVINAITERKGVKTALVTTAGFRDVLEIGRGNRPDLYNLQFHSPQPFVPRHLRFEVRERLGAGGVVVDPLHLEDLAPIIEACRAQNVEAIAVVFLHSYANADHERRCASVLAAALPGVAVCASHQVSRQWREYERSNTVVLNAYVLPIIRRYFASLQAALLQRGVACPTYAMQSNGGIATFDQAIRQPLTLVESGPSGGVAGAIRIGAALGIADVLYLDVGGTTAKCSLIHGGRPNVEALYKLGWTRLFPGYPVQAPVVDIVEIGSGGGSIARIDESGGLRVGPESAGALPGPACYRRGGNQPTVTDAMLVVGMLDPDAFAGGAIQLDLGLARAAFGPLADRLGGSIESAAHAVIAIAEADMINALKLVSIQRGHDPRDFALVVSGGAGPALAARLGRELKVRTTVIPPYAGIFSAWGMLAAQPRADLRRTWFSSATPDAIARLAILFEELESEALSSIGEGDDGDVAFSRSVEMRYRGQEHSVSTPFHPGDDLAALLAAFHKAHESAFSFHLPETAAEITNLHLQCKLPGDVVELPKLAGEARSQRAAKRGERHVYWGPEEGSSKCPVYLRDRLPVRELCEGPALIEEETTTTLVLSGQNFELTDTGILVIREAIK